MAETPSKDTPAPYSLLLTAEEQAAHDRLLAAFKASTQQHDGSAAADERSLNLLIEVDNHLRQIDAANNFEGAYREQVSVNALLDTIRKPFNRAMAATDEEGLMALLQKGGAVVVKDNLVFVRTDPKPLPSSSGDAGGEPLHKSAPKFREVIEALQSIGVFADHLVIRRGETDAGMMRDKPYRLIQVPQRGVEIAVCDLIGETVLFSPKILGPQAYALHTKRQLQEQHGVQPVHYKGDWQARLCALIEEQGAGLKAPVDLKQFAKETPALNDMLVLAGMLDYAAEHKGKLPSRQASGFVPGMPGKTWMTLDANGVKGECGLEKRKTLSVIKNHYGLMAGKRENPEAVTQAVKNWREQGILPEPVEYNENPLSARVILQKMLEYAASNNGCLPHKKTLDSISGMPGRTWKGLDSNGDQGLSGLEKGETLSVIKNRYGLMTGKKENPEAVALAVKNWKEQGILPEPVEQKDMRLTAELVLQKMLEYAAEHEGQLPSYHTPGYVSGMPGKTWTALDSNGLKGEFGLGKGETLSVIKNRYGLMTGKRGNPEAVALAVKNWKGQGILPEPVEQKDMRLTAELVLQKMLECAVEKDGHLPNVDTLGFVPGMPGKTWKGLDANGRNGEFGMEKGETLCAIKNRYGLMTGRNENPEAICRAVENWKRYGILPEPVQAASSGLSSQARQTVPSP